MARALEQSKYMVLIGVIALLVAAAVTFGWGAIKTISFVAMLVNSAGSDPLTIVRLLEVVDTFLIATVLLIISLGLYYLFIDKLQLPEWLVIDDLSKLKGKLSDVVVLFMAIKFLEKLLQSKDSQELIFFALSVAVVAAVLIAFNYSRKE
jgi:uncharacterized membrane protein YqhA